MKVTIITNRVTVSVEDSPTIGSDQYTKRNVPELTIVLKQVIDEALILHNAIK